MKHSEFYLLPLDLDHLELLRTWRNDIDNRTRLQNQNFITPDEQLNWYKSLDTNIFKQFILYHGMDPIGEVHLKDYDSTLGTAECGIMMAPKYHGTGLAFAGSYLLFEYAFDFLNINVLFAKVQTNNHHANRYNLFLGFSLVGEIELGYNKFLLDKKKYRLNKTKLLKVISAL